MYKYCLNVLVVSLASLWLRLAKQETLIQSDPLTMNSVSLKTCVICGTNNRAPGWTFTDHCKPEVRPGARKESASPAWLAAPARNGREFK